jgi:hypothetical protein
MAHEIGHVLLEPGRAPAHYFESWDNLMFVTTSEIKADPPMLTKAQVAIMKTSPLCRPS